MGPTSWLPTIVGLTCWLQVFIYLFGNILVRRLELLFTYTTSSTTISAAALSIMRNIHLLANVYTLEVDVSDVQFPFAGLPKRIERYSSQKSWK